MITNKRSTSFNISFCSCDFHVFNSTIIQPT